MRMRKYFIFITIILTIILGACAGSGVTSASGDPDDQDQRRISVNGTGRVSLIPDIARVTVGVHTEDENAVEAVASNNSLASKIVQALENYDIASEDIQTTNFNIYPRQIWGTSGQQLGITYVVDNNVRVTLRDLELIGEILNAVIQAGANSINGIQFDVDDREGANHQALEAAIENARARAETITKAAGIEIGEIITLESFIGGGGVETVFVERAFAADMAAEVPISTGQMEVVVSVNIVYAIP